MPVYYYVPEQDRPSWGSGIIYYHVWLLNKNNIEAYILHDKKPYKLQWILLDIPFRYISAGLKLEKEDTLIVPEFYADLPQLSKFHCKKIVFVQNAFYIFDGLKEVKSYEDLEIKEVFYIMPHLKKILQQITALPLFEIPPFIAPYFYTANDISVRRKRILIYPKFHNRDYIILKRMLEDTLGMQKKSMLQKLFSKDGKWEIIEIKDKKHQEVAEEMKQAVFFISLNTNEAFNSSVPEAMAAGCINICYEGVGPADFLENDVNAFVFSNNHIYSLIEKVIDLVTNYNEFADQLNVIRNNARKTADTYTINKLENRLVNFFKARTLPQLA